MLHMSEIKQKLTDLVLQEVQDFQANLEQR